MPHELNLRRGQGIGLVDEVAEGALQFQGFGGEGEGGLDGAGISASKDVAAPGWLQPSCRDMPQSLSAVYIHLVFSTKHRRPLLRDAARRVPLHAYLGSISKNLDCPPLLVGGVEDHVHMLCRFGRTIAQAEWVKELKRVSNLWLQEQGPDYADFQ